MNWQKAAGIAGLAVGVLAIGSTAIGGVRYFLTFESRIAALEDNGARFQEIDDRLDSLEHWRQIARDRWAKHFNLWGDAIEARERELGIE